MGVYIKGMEMPKNCLECPLVVCLSVESDCPLIPVQPHGRVIDADEFLKRAIGTKCLRGDYALMLEELVGESATIIPADEGET